MRKSYQGISMTFFVIIFFLNFIFAGIADDKTDQIDRLFAQWNRVDSPGCSLAIIHNGKIIYKKGYGMANLEQSISISPSTVFYVGSCSKQFTAMSVALLAREKKLSMDDDIRKYIPELPDYGNLIKVHHLIHHTSGLRDYLTLLEIAGIPFGNFHKEDVLELIARQKELNFKPGEEYLYSNSGYFLLAILVERVSGKIFRQFAEENIFQPLGMKNSLFLDDYTLIIKNRASGYFPGGPGKYRNFISTFDCVGSGGLYTTVEDLFLWDQNFYHCRVGGKDLIELIQTPGELNSGKKLDYAFGLTVGDYRGLKTVGHGGALGGYRAGMIRFPEQKFSVICLSNLSTFDPTKLCLQVADIFLAGNFKKEKEEVRAKPEEKPSFLNLPENKLKEYEGDYRSEELQVTFRIALGKDGKLYFVHKNAPRSPLLAAQPDQFLTRGWTIHFIRDKENKIVAFKLDAGRVKSLHFDKRG